MNITVRITAELLSSIRQDLRRQHAYAHERVGFISAGLAGAGNNLLILAREYRPDADDDYLDDRRFGAVMGSNAIRKAQQWALSDGVALLHVHTHGGRGIPRFSKDDLSENPKFIADFFKVAPQCAHGAIVLSDTAARGQIWLQRGGADFPVDTFQVIGAPLVTWQVPA